ncbi:hypothetical protein SH591_00525 [Sphingomonas sp. LY54]|uniref:hypothetical protein n=1 Tax=Sphingomonas sp. LY54 TaxID=3095343 RepID=UPI002D77AD2E|nr:hypothetical protein [Sphingomonas sp. LY54]WRP28708.1 hypothetical protein SH591_00525 [Sphingomonas sp. LY54]
MTWSPLVLIVMITLLATGVLIAFIENWSRLGPICSRWSWLLETAFALWFGYSAFQALQSGEILWGWIALLVGGIFAGSAATRIRRMRRLE